MNQFYIAPIVEGQGEVEALPILLHRFLHEVNPEAILRVNNPIRVKAGSMIRDDTYFARHVRLASLKAKGQPKGSVLLLLDCEDDCPALVGPKLLERACRVESGLPILVILAYREYETWFLSAARSLRGVAGLAADLEPPAAPEGLRDAKGWLSTRMNRPYNPPMDQPAMTRSFSLGEAAANPSFRRLRSKLHTLFRSAGT